MFINLFIVLNIKNIVSSSTLKLAKLSSDKFLF